MTTEHNSDNAAEVKRILDEHPKEEERDIIRGDRLLGILAPLRAFGDFKFKWMEETINQVLGCTETPIKAFDFRKQLVVSEIKKNARVFCMVFFYVNAPNLFCFVTACLFKTDSRTICACVKSRNAYEKNFCRERHNLLL